LLLGLLTAPSSDCRRIQSFYRHHSPENRHRKIRERVGELVRRINAGGGKEARGLQADGLGVFPNFIAAIFIDDVLRSLHHPYVLESV
jgi:hypothetical protein